MSILFYLFVLLPYYSVKSIFSFIWKTVKFISLHIFKHEILSSNEKANIDYVEDIVGSCFGPAIPFDALPTVISGWTPINKALFKCDFAPGQTEQVSSRVFNKMPKTSHSSYSILNNNRARWQLFFFKEGVVLLERERAFLIRYNSPSFYFYPGLNLIEEGWEFTRPSSLVRNFHLAILDKVYYHYDYSIDGVNYHEAERRYTTSGKLDRRFKNNKDSYSIQSSSEDHFYTVQGYKLSLQSNDSLFASFIISEEVTLREYWKELFIINKGFEPAPSVINGPIAINEPYHLLLSESEKQRACSILKKTVKDVARDVKVQTRMTSSPVAKKSPLRIPLGGFLDDLVKSSTNRMNQRVTGAFFSTSSSVESQLEKLWEEVVERHRNSVELEVKSKNKKLQESLQKLRRRNEEVEKDLRSR